MSYTETVKTGVRLRKRSDVSLMDTPAKEARESLIRRHSVHGLQFEGYQADAIIKIHHILHKLDTKWRNYESLPMAHAYDFLKSLRDSYPMGEWQVTAEAKLRRILEEAGVATTTMADALAYLEHKAMDELSASMDKISWACKAGAKRLLEYHELPFDYQNNPFILKGYRFYEEKWDCVKSIVRIHNETCNIWTHLGGFIGMIVLGTVYYPQTPSFAASTLTDKLVFGVFFVSACKCLFLSAFWHVFSSFGNPRAMRKIACMDYVGISLLIASSIITTEYYCFGRAHPSLAGFYMSLTGLLGLIGVVIPWFTWFDLVENRLWRVAFFVGVAISGAVPMMHYSYLTSIAQAVAFLAPINKSLLSYIIGVVVYANQVPERWMPGYFDHFGASHQLWHVAILMGIYFHYKYIITVSESIL